MVSTLFVLSLATVSSALSISGSTIKNQRYSGVDCGTASVCRITCDVDECFGTDPFTINLQHCETLEIVLETRNSTQNSHVSVYGGTGIDFNVEIVSKFNSSEFRVSTFQAQNSSKMRVVTDVKMGTAILDARTADSLYVSAGAQEALATTTIYTPTEGNAYLSMTEQKALYGITVISGTHADRIYIDCSAPWANSEENCGNINVHAETAQYLEMKAAASGAGIGSDAPGKNVITCPRDSTYRHPEFGASCALLTENGGEIRKVEVRAKDGFPKNLYISRDATIQELIVKCGANYMIESAIHDYSEYGDPSQLCFITDESLSTSASTNTPNWAIFIIILLSCGFLSSFCFCLFCRERRLRIQIVADVVAELSTDVNVNQVADISDCGEVLEVSDGCVDNDADADEPDAGVEDASVEVAGVDVAGVDVAGEVYALEESKGADGADADVDEQKADPDDPDLFASMLAIFRPEAVQLESIAAMKIEGFILDDKSDSEQMDHGETTSGATAGIDSNLGVYELNMMADL